MSTALPHGYVSFREAAKTLRDGLFAGLPDRPEVAKLRADLGMDVGDGEALQSVTREIWKAVDQGRLRLMAIGGIPRRLIRLDAEMTKEIPLLRRACGFYYLRPAHPLHSHFVGWFGRELHKVELAFRAADVNRLAKTVRRRKPHGSTRRGGRPRRRDIEPVIRQLIDARQGKPFQSMKTLTHSVNRRLSKRASEDTVGRTFDRMYEDARDRKFARVRRSRKSNAR